MKSIFYVSELLKTFKNEQVMSKGNVVIGALAGVAVGALLGILFAPDKGTETRRKISSKGKEAAEDLKDKFNDFVDEVSSRFDKRKKETVAEENAEV
ncbi:MAG TPA: YtxH domain-containing protein [Bacteroidales bacterium]|jgi:gas vesicle protein|nr:YtxH domain-containing protein [Bacteroidales bacterium]